jgi:hypothetical protein
MNAFAVAGFTATNSVASGWCSATQVGEPLQAKPALVRVLPVRGFPTRDLVPVVGQFGELGEGDLAAGLQLGQLLERPLAGAVLLELPEKPVVGLDGLAAGPLEGIVAGVADRGGRVPSIRTFRLMALRRPLDLNKAYHQLLVALDNQCHKWSPVQRL